MSTASAGAAHGCALSSVKNIVLVHGAFADGSGWRGVYDVMTARGFAVSIVQNPLTSFADDVAATRRVLSRQDGPAILVGHSYGGSVITEAGTDPKVTALSMSRPSRRRSGNPSSTSMRRSRHHRRSCPRSIRTASPI